MSLLLILSGAQSGAPPPPPPQSNICTPAFQPLAFQFGAFQICRQQIVGWPDTLHRRVPRKKLEKLLKLQRDATFGPKWFEEFEQAQKEFAAAEEVAFEQEAEAARRQAQEALADAAREAKAAAGAAREDREHKWRLNQIAAALQVAQDSKQAADRLASANYAYAGANWLKRKADEENDDDEEALMLLLDG